MENCCKVSGERTRLPPPVPSEALRCGRRKESLNKSNSLERCDVSTATRDVWGRMFDEAYRADVVISTDQGWLIYAHASILGMSSPALRGILKQSRRHGRKRMISIRGVPYDAVHAFIRFLYTSCYEPEEMREFALHLLVLSHSYVVPQLKKLCEQQLEQGLTNVDNVTDILQVALLCDAPRLSLICHRMIMKNFKAITATEGWRVMKMSHPMLEKQILESLIEEDTRKNGRLKKLGERKMYLELYEAMEALVHIFNEGCRTIGPHDKVPKEDQSPCRYESCKGLEMLVRHFAGCKQRTPSSNRLKTPGGCVHCKRMWQLLDLHSRLCIDSSACRVPLCRFALIYSTKLLFLS
uniref:BTB domain-containing protein n=1 Tax=Kalanchoe fedtschenkoi TaxID=63787 RepID=A0A7N0T5M6_KALFE